MGTLESGRSFDPRYSSSFQRGGEPVARARAEAPPRADPWGYAGLDEIAAGIDADDRAAEDLGVAGGEQPGSSTTAGPTAESITYVRRWGVGLVVVSSAALVVTGVLQQSINGNAVYNGDMQWFWIVQQFVFTAAPWAFVFGLGCLVFAGYSTRNRVKVEERA